ncbi:MAG: type IV pilus biogenesis/stability protein PilW [Gammaproteobacteria bacterium]|nr:type IV pilus biogenesis/stability protein PilW [Gammaproteobacteria bacterium]
MNGPVFILSRFCTLLFSVKTRLLAMLLAVVFISGCASQQSNDLDQKSKGRRAAEANTSLGLEYMNRGQNEVALGKLKKAISEDSSYAPAHTVLAVLYEQIGEMKLAGQHYKKAYEADPGDGDVNNNYGVYLCQTDKQKQAMMHFLKALDDPFYSSPSVALTNAGSCTMRQGDMVTANEYLRAALKIEPGFPDALLNMAKLNYEEENYLKARAFLQRYEAAASHNAESLLLGYRIETASRDSETANKYKRMLESNFPDSSQTTEVRRLPGK